MRFGGNVDRCLPLFHSGSGTADSTKLNEKMKLKSKDTTRLHARRLSAHNAWGVGSNNSKTEAVAELDLYSLHLSCLFVVQIDATNLSLVIPYFVGRKPNIMK